MKKNVLGPPQGWQKKQLGENNMRRKRAEEKKRIQLR